jgi:hypothetical protein
MSFHETFSAKNVVINYAATDISTGRPEDAFITISQGAPRAAFRKGLDGNTSASLSADNSVTVTLSLFPESNSAKILTGLYYAFKQALRQGEAVLGALPLIVADPSGTIFLVAKETVLMNLGDLSLSEDTGTIDFEFYVEDALASPLTGELADILSNATKDAGVKV